MLLFALFTFKITMALYEKHHFILNTIYIRSIPLITPIHTHITPTSHQYIQHIHTPTPYSHTHTPTTPRPPPLPSPRTNCTWATTAFAMISQYTTSPENYNHLRTLHLLLVATIRYRRYQS